MGEALAGSRVRREHVFLTTKVHPRSLGYWNTLATFAQSQRDLRTDWIDLVLLHYPYCGADLCGPQFNPEGTWMDRYGAGLGGGRAVGAGALRAGALGGGGRGVSWRLPEVLRSRCCGAACAREGPPLPPPTTAQSKAQPGASPCLP